MDHRIVAAATRCAKRRAFLINSISARVSTNEGRGMAVPPCRELPMIQRILAAALSLGLASAAQAAEFNCFARVGPPCAAQDSSTLMGRVNAGGLRQAEAEYYRRTSTAKPVSAGGRVIHELYCMPRAPAGHGGPAGPPTPSGGRTP